MEAINLLEAVVIVLWFILVHLYVKFRTGAAVTNNFTEHFKGVLRSNEQASWIQDGVKDGSNCDMERWKDITHTPASKFPVIFVAKTV